MNDATGHLWAEFQGAIPERRAEIVIEVATIRARAAFDTARMRPGWGGPSTA